MPQYIPIITEIGTLWGARRDLSRLSKRVPSISHRLLCRERSIAPWRRIHQRQSGRLTDCVFCDVLALQMTELDTWEALQDGHWTETSSDEVVNSTWLARIKVTATLRHLVFQTYDHVFEVLCTRYELELGETND